jgi:hypothetical protein
MRSTIFSKHPLSNLVQATTLPDGDRIEPRETGDEVAFPSGQRLWILHQARADHTPSRMLRETTLNRLRVEHLIPRRATALKEAMGSKPGGVALAGMVAAEHAEQLCEPGAISGCEHWPPPWSGSIRATKKMDYVAKTG